MNFKWVRKIESTRKAFETDKQNIRSELNSILPYDEINDFDKFDDHAEQERFSQNDHSSTSQVRSSFRDNHYERNNAYRRYNVTDSRTNPTSKNYFSQHHRVRQKHHEYLPPSLTYLDTF